MSIITCKSLSLGYDGVNVISNLYFTVESGDYICIVGENGSGKSTLVKGLLGLKKPDKGEILFAEGLSHRDIGYLPQQSAMQKDFPASVFEVVLSGRLNSLKRRPFFTAEDKRIAREMMERMGVTELRNASYQNLSGGQQQRVLLARAMCAGKQLLLLDEPATGLDPLVTADLYEQIDKANKEHGMTVIMVSHDIPTSLQYAKHILHLGRDGHACFGTPEQYAQSHLGKLFLGGGKDA